MYKRKSKKKLSILSSALIASAAMLTVRQANAVSLYWDTNGVVGGAGGATPSGNWVTSGGPTRWNTDPAGGAGTLTDWTSTANDAIFSAGADATGSYTVAVDEAITANKIQLEEGSLTLSTTQPLTVGAGGVVVNSGTSLTVTAGALFTTGAGGITVNGTGTMSIGGGNLWAASGSQTWTNNNNNVGGTLNVTASGSASSTGILNLTGAGNYFFGGTSFQNIPSTFTFSVNSATTIGSGLNLSGGSQVFNVNGSNQLTMDIGSGGLTFLGGTYTGGISFVKNGLGEFRINNTANNYSGATTINAGTISCQASNNLSPNSTYVFNPAAAATVLLNPGAGNGSHAIAGLSFAGAINGVSNVTIGFGALSVAGNITYDSTNNPATATISNLASFGTLNLAGAVRTITVGDSTNSTAELTVTAIVTNGGMTKEGAGVLLLTGATNTYAGATTVNNGTLRVANAASMGTSAATVNAGTLEINNVVVTANNNLTLNNGAQLLGSGGSASAYSKANFPSIGTVASTAVKIGTVASGDTLSINSAIRDGSATALVTVNGPGTVVVSSGSTTATAYAGSWLVDGASTTLLRLSDANALGNPTNTTPRPIEIKNGNVELRVSTGSTFTTATTISGNVGITLSRGAAGTSNTHTMGFLTMGSNTLTVSHGINYNASNVGSVNFGTTSFTGNPTFTLNNTNTIQGVTTLGAITDTGTARTITKGGNATMTLGTAATSLVDGTAVNITAGILNSNNTTALGSLANVTVSTGGTFNVGASQTVGALNTAGTGSTALGANTLTVGNAVNNLNSNYSGVISGAGGGITKEGGGTFTVTNTNTYTGPTKVNAGKMLVNSPGALNSSSVVTVNSGGTLGGSGGTINGPVTVNAGGTFAPGASIGTIHVNNSLTLAGASSYEIDHVADIQDHADSITSLTYGGSLSVTDISGAGLTLWSNTDVFDLFDTVPSTAHTGFFGSITLPAPPAQFRWKTFTGAGQNGQMFDYVNGLIQVEDNVTQGKYSLSAGTASSRVLLNGVTDISATITNSGTALDDKINFTGLKASSAANGTVTSIPGGGDSGGPLNQGQSYTKNPALNSGTLSFQGTGYDNGVVVTPTVSTVTNDALLSPPNATSTGTSTVTITVGNAIANRSANNRSTFGQPLTGKISNAGSHANLASKVTGEDLPTGGAPMLGSTATILAGTASANTTVSMAWRTRNQNEVAGQSTTPPFTGFAPAVGLVSDVVNLTGIAPSGGGTFHGSTQTDVFVLQMTYDETELAKFVGPDQFAADTDLVGLGYLDLGADGLANTSDDRWRLAVEGNFNFEQLGHVYQGSYLSYFAGTSGSYDHNGATPGFKSANSFALGDWGVDVNSDVVWAVVNHNSEFAAIPEPTSLSLVGLAGAGLLGRRRRNRRK